MAKKQPYSIQVHLATIMIGFCAFILIALWLFQIVFLNDFYRGIKYQAINRSIRSIQKTVATVDFGLTLDRETFEEQMNTISIQNDSCAIIASEYAMVNANTSNTDCVISNLAGLSIQDVRSYIDAIKAQGGTVKLYGREKVALQDGLESENWNRDNTRNGEKYLIHGITATDVNGNDVLILMATSIKPIHIVTNILKSQLWLIFLIVLGASMIVVVLMSRLIARPIAHINEEAKKLAHGDDEPHFSEKGYKEIAELNDTLNYVKEELSKVENLRRELIANVSHDLRTPLTMISGYGEVMRDIPGENTPDNVQVIIDEANRLTSMVNNLLDVSRLEANAGAFHPTVSNITALLEQIVMRYQKLLQPKGYTIHWEYDQQAYAAFDATQLTSAINNLMNNAINYTGADHTVSVRQTVADGWVRVDIIDTGEGLAAEELPYVWDRYYRVDREHKRSVMGTGLGLSIVKSVFQLHHADYGVISEPQKGSDFYFRLPLAESEEHGEKKMKSAKRHVK